MQPPVCVLLGWQTKRLNWGFLAFQALLGILVATALLFRSPLPWALVGAFVVGAVVLFQSARGKVVVDDRALHVSPLGNLGSQLDIPLDRITSVRAEAGAVLIVTEGASEHAFGPFQDAWGRTADTALRCERAALAIQRRCATAAG